MDTNSKQNTDKEIWRQPTTRDSDGGLDSGMEPHVFVTQGGGIGFDYYGTCVVRTIEEWVKLANKNDETTHYNVEPDFDVVKRNMMIVCEARKQAILDAIEALRPPDIRPSLEVRKESEYVDGRCSEMTYLDNRIAVLKEREGI